MHYVRKLNYYSMLVYCFFIESKLRYIAYTIIVMSKNINMDIVGRENSYHTIMKQMNK